MSKYTKEIIDVLLSLRSEQVGFFVDKLNIDEIKILSSIVLPEIQDLDCRRSLRNMLITREKIINENLSSEVTSNFLHENKNIGDHLEVVFEKLTTTILHSLYDEERRKRFLQRANDDELYVLLRKILLNDSKEDAKQWKALQDALVSEVVQRNSYRKSKDDGLQWKANIWQDIIDSIEQIDFEILNEKTEEVPVEEPENNKKFWLFRVWFEVKNFIFNLFVFFGFFDVQSSVTKENKKTPVSEEENNFLGKISPSAGEITGVSTAKDIYNQSSENYTLVITEEERGSLEGMRQSGAQHVANITGTTKIGEKIRTKENIKSTIMTRFGMVVASQMVSGTKSENHRSLYTVGESLTQPEDNDATIEEISSAIKTVITDERDLLLKEHAFSTGGFADLVTAIESEVVGNLVPQKYSQYGLTFTEEETAQIKQYYENMERSRDLGHILATVGRSWGGYEEDKYTHGYKKSSDFEIKQAKYEQQLATAGKALQQACIDLNEGEALYLETGLEGHAMQLVIKKIGNEFKLSTYDSSGALENTSLSTSPLGLVKLSRMTDETMRKNAYTFSVPKERLISEVGLDYLTYLIRSNSMAGWAQTHIELNIKHTTMEERSHMGWLRERLALRQQSYIYSNYMEHFGSIASPDAPPKFEDILQRPQNTENCFAKKAQSCELYELGKPTYKKLRLAMLLEQRKGLLQDACGKPGESSFVSVEYTTMLKNIEPEYLSPSELQEVSMRLCEVKEPPSKEYYQKFFQALFAAKEKLATVDKSDNNLAIKRIDEKIASHAKSYYLYLKKGNRQKEIEEIFSPAVYSQDSIFNWDAGGMPLKTNEDGKIVPKALEKLSEYATAQSWKAIFQLINHQIKKLSVNERYIQSSSERLSYASYRQVSGKVKLNDLEKANIVSFTEGFTRKEEIRVEINVGNKRKEIDLPTFFKLVLKNKESLTNPKVIGLLDYIRNVSPEIENMYAAKVYPAQRQAFVDKLEGYVEHSMNSLTSTINRLSESKDKLSIMLEQCKQNIDSVTYEMTKEQQILGNRKKSVKLKNLELRLELLKEEQDELERLQRSVAVKIQSLEANKEVKGSPANKIAKTKNIIERLKANDADLQTVNAVSHAFTAAAADLENVNQQLEKTIKTFEIDDVEQENDRLIHVNQYRKKVIANHLATNAEYRILDELSAGRMGTEKDRNRQMYRQSAVERAEFFKKGSFLEGSVFHEIQNLNQKLRAEVCGIVEQKVILNTNIIEVGTIDSLKSANDEYINIDNHSQAISKRVIPEEIKEKWVRGMFDIWLKHESQGHLYALQKKNEADPTAINQAFHHFIEQKANIKYAALKEAGYPIDLNKDQIEKMWRPISEPEIVFINKRKQRAAGILKRFIKAMGSENTVLKEDTPYVTPIRLTNKELVTTQDPTLKEKVFEAPAVTYLSQSARDALDESTLKFLRENPIPTPEGGSKEQCFTYFTKVTSFLHRLKAHNSLENKSQRITEFCYLSVSKIFDLSYAPPASLVTEIANTVIDRYRGEDGYINDSFLKLENNQRAQILITLIKLNLSQIAADESQKTKVNSAFYSTIKQWEKLIIPPDEAMSRKIAMLSPGGTIPEDISLLKEVDTALHESPVSLEGIYEGQKGLQIALAAYGAEKEVNSELRKVADCLSMRNGDALLAHQFLAYYSKSKFLLSADGINSTQGRELFTRALLDAFQHGTDVEKHELLDFLKGLKFDNSDGCKLKTPHKVFIEEVLIKCSNMDSKFTENIGTEEGTSTIETESFISSLTDTSSTDGVDRLFGFAKEINTIALKIERNLNKKPIDKAELDGLYAKLICSNLAYQLLLGQASEDIISNLNENFEYTREMSLVQSNMSKLRENLIEFSSNLNIDKRIALFNKIFNEYAQDKKFDGRKVNVTSASSLDIPGFINLGGNKSLDVLHGVIYLGNSKFGGIPAYIQSYIALQELGLQDLPFNPLSGGYVYVEDDQIKASLTPLADGSIVIQRELRTLDDTSEILQYIPPDKMESVPVALRRIKAEHFFIDSKGTLHAYNSDFAPILKLSRQDELWSGTLLDHHGNKVPITLDNTKDSPVINELSKVFPADEIISVNENTVYIPSIAKYLIHEKANGYFIADDLTERTSRRHLKVTEEGSVYTEKELTSSEAEEVRLLNKEIAKLQNDLASVTQSDLLSQQAKNKIEKKIKDCESRIQVITSPEYFVFVADSKQIKALEEAHLQSRKEMQKAYTAFRDGGKNRKLASNYEQAKEHYLQEKKTLKKAYEVANYLRVYTSKEGVLEPQDFQSILHVGLIPDKTPLLIQLLGKNVPKLPLKSSELEDLRTLKTQYKEKQPLTMEDRFALIMLMGTELQHHLLEREACVTGKIKVWDRKSHNELLKEFTDEVNKVNELFGQLPLDNFSELWRSIHSEFATDEKLQQLFTKPIATVSTGEKKPVSINTRTTYMPIESLGARALVQFNLYKDPQSLIDEQQLELEQRLRGLEKFGDSVQAQEDGYYYENYGLFHTGTLEKLFSVTLDHPGVEGLTEIHVSELFDLMQKEGWIGTVKGMDKYQLAGHPSEFYSSSKIASYLTEIGFRENQIRTISDRLETFLYQTAVNGGTYSIKADKKEDLERKKGELIEKLTQAQEKCNIESLQALDKIKSILAESSTEISLTELNSAYLLNDYSRILSHFPEDKRARFEIILNNAMTRLLYYKTELDHLNDVKNTFQMGQDAKAISMLHIRRNYPLEKLLDSELYSGKDLTGQDLLQAEQERKMQRAFLLFESEFGHRCNARQVNIFRGLLLDDETDPDKIDAAQARMGFGKTSLLPLVALYKTGEKLVRFIVPKSALESNTSDMSLALGNILGSRAVKDDFHRYRIETDPESNMGTNSPRLKSLQDAKADLKKRLSLYQRITENREVLVQAPSVRNSLECQLKIFLDMLPKLANEPLQKKELMECISLLNEIRSLETISIFDELDATQDTATTEVNYTSGEKISLDTAEIYPLELITQTIGATEDKTAGNLAKILLERFNIIDADKSIFNYITSLQVKQPDSVTPSNSTEVYLMRAILTDPAMLSIFTEKEPGTDFGVWFQNASDGSKLYDRDALKTGGDSQSNKPLLIAVPYSAANTPKPKGSRFDNPEVSAITTFLYYLDPRTELNEVPHLEFLIDSFRSGLGEAPFLEPSGERISPEFTILFNDIKTLAEIEDPIIRGAAREQYFVELNTRIKKGEIPPNAFRKMLARTIIQEQIKFDAGKANSNRYEQGTTRDVVIGFSGTAGDTSSYFRENMLDPAADGNMTLGIMGRANCQKTVPLDTTSFSEKGEDYTTTIIKQLTASFSSNTRTLIDVGGLCKVSNRAVAKEIALQLKSQGSPLKGVIFYDDVTNMKKLLVLDSQNKEKVVDLTAAMVAESDRKGSYFTYYDQSHSRGADIKQMDGAHAVLTLNFTVTNNDYKQAIMRMRKIVEKPLGQSFSVAVPDSVREKIISDLKLTTDHILTGNDIGLWLRQKELENNLNHASLLSAELDAVVKNAILQQQAEITKLMSDSDLTEKQIKAFTECIKQLNSISPLVSNSVNDLRAKYGNVYGEVRKQDFVNDLKESFDKRMIAIFNIVRQTREEMGLAPVEESDKKAYYDLEQRIIKKREAQLSNVFTIPSASNALSEAHSETESQSESQSQSQSQAQTHSFSEVAKEEVVVKAKLRKHDIPHAPVSLGYLSGSSALDELPKAAQTTYMHHLFHEDDSVRCSPAYVLDEELELSYAKPVPPPIRYFLAREEGEPKIILISQDEANAFKGTPVAPWSLYDVRFKISNAIAPVMGSPITSLKDPLLKKLNFASYRYKVSGADMDSIAGSLDEMYTQEQLHPSLSIHYATTEHSSFGNAPVFELSRWGFRGEKLQDMLLRIEKTETSIGGHNKKEGLTISVEKGNARVEVFISDKLSQRISNESGKPKLKKVMEVINKDYGEVKQDIDELTEDLRVLQETEEKVIKDFDQQIMELEAIKEKAVNEARAKIDKGFYDGMNGLINCRGIYEEQLSQNLREHCSARVHSNEWGIKVSGNQFEQLGDAIAHGCNKLYTQNKATPLSFTELEQELDAEIQTIFNAVDQRYQYFINYKALNVTLFESMHAATKGKRNPQNENVKVWSQSLEEALKNQFFDIYMAWMDNEANNPNEKWQSFVGNIKDEILQARGSDLTLEDFYEKILARVEKFAHDNAIDVNDFTAIVMPRLDYFINSGSKKENTQTIQDHITNIIKKQFLEVLTTPTEDQVEFFARLQEMVKNKIDKHNYEVPSILLDYQKDPLPLKEIKVVVRQSFSKQSVRTAKGEIDFLTRKIASFLAGRKEVQNILDNYQPVENRSAQLEGKGNISCSMFPSNYDALAELDRQTFDIQKQITEAKIQKKAQLDQLKEKQVELQSKLDQSNEKAKILQDEVSALNELLTGGKELLSFLANCQVVVEEDEPADFIEAHFDLDMIIAHDISSSATLTFIPPEIYEVEREMQQQFINLHGLDEEETAAGRALDEAFALVRKEVGIVQERKPHIEYELNNQSEVTLQKTGEMKADTPEIPVQKHEEMREDIPEIPVEDEIIREEKTREVVNSASSEDKQKEKITAESFRAFKSQFQETVKGNDEDSSDLYRTKNS